MRCKTFLFATTVSLSIIVSGCSDKGLSPSKKDSDVITKDESGIQSRPKKTTPSLASYKPVYDNPKPVIDYSSPENTVNKEPEFNFNKSANIFSWEDPLHHKPLSYIKSEYDFDNKISPLSFIDLITYSDDELAVLDNAFPNSISVNDIESVYDGNTINLKKSAKKLDENLTTDKDGNIKIRLMNIDCPELPQKGGNLSKDVLSEFIDIKSHIKGDKKPTIKLRYRITPQQELPLAIVTLDFGSHEFSLNRSMVYSGWCFNYAQYNQDQLMFDMSSYAQQNNKGMWANKAVLLALNEWVMPWDYREHIAPYKD